MCIFSIFLLVAWDPLRIGVYGFNAFAKCFLNCYPTYFISPLRISGSAVESLFSQYKYSAGGKLGAANYATARCSHLVKQCVASHQAGKDYRDQSVGIELPLVKHKYGKASTKTCNILTSVLLYYFIFIENSHAQYVPNHTVKNACTILQ